MKKLLTLTLILLACLIFLSSGPIQATETPAPEIEQPEQVVEQSAPQPQVDPRLELQGMRQYRQDLTNRLIEALSQWEALKIKIPRLREEIRGMNAEIEKKVKEIQDAQKESEENKQ